MKRILVAVDGSDPARRALQLAAEIAQRFEAKLTLVSVLPSLPLPEDAYGPRATELVEGHRSFSLRLLAVMGAAVDAKGLQLESLVLEGNPAEEIAHAAIEQDVDLVVVGSRGLGAMSRTLLGSVSDRLVHIATKPVLVVH
jgi:nucleotide-binding universal stress UspA family protein